MKYFVLLFALFAFASCGRRDEWIAIARAPKDAVISIHFALSQYNIDVLESTLLDVSDITSTNYGKWWTAEAITNLVAPPASVSAQITSFLSSLSSDAVVLNRRDSIKMTATVSVIEEMLQIDLHLYRHHKLGKYIIRAETEYMMPSEIENDVDFIAGILEFPVMNELASSPLVGEGEDALIVPETINSLYQIPANFPIHPNSSICVVEFLNDSAILKSDLATFASGTATNEITISQIVGNFSGSNLESTLDVEYGGVTSQGTTLWFWSESGWMYDFATDFFAHPSPPLVVSISWGWPEPQQCGRVNNCTNGENSFEYVTRTNAEFAKIGLRGVTILASSGDNGAPGDLNIDCSDHGKNVLSTIFPGASPWVLSVGATMLTNSTNPVHTPPICQKYGCATSTEEIVCTYPESLITTGGGFSDYSPLPTWQQAAVTSYLKDSSITIPPTKYFNATNRGFPDVSALGHNYVIAMGNDWNKVDGTSASTPVWGAIISLLNSHRLSNGKPSLGFVAPLLYQAYASDPSIFNDITSGNNKCTEACCDKYGYEATTGWDPATGLGTPVFPKLLQFISTLP